MFYSSIFRQFYKFLFKKTNHFLSINELMIGSGSNYIFSDFIFFKNSLFKQYNNVEYFIYSRDLFIGIHWVNKIEPADLNKESKIMDKSIDNVLKQRLKVVNKRNYSIKTMDKTRYKYIHKVIGCNSNKADSETALPKYFINSAKEFYHIVSGKDYKIIADKLYTLQEISKYFNFRHDFVQINNGETLDFPEEMIINEYLLDHYNGLIFDKDSFSNFDLNLTHNKVNILENIFSATFAPFSNEYRKYDYYGIISKLAFLALPELIKFYKKYNELKYQSENKILLSEYTSEISESGIIYLNHQISDWNLEAHERKYNLILNGYQYQNRFEICLVILFYSNLDNDINIKSSGIRFWIHYPPGDVICS